MEERKIYGWRMNMLSEESMRRLKYMHLIMTWKR